MIHELRAYDLKPGAGPAYLSLFLRQGIGAVTRHLPLAGYWLTDTGALNRLYHLWIYENLQERAAARIALAADRDWVEGFVPHGFPMIVTQRNMLMERLEGGPMLAAAETTRKTHRPDMPDAPVFAEGLQSLTFGGGVCSEQPVVGRWRVLSGEAVEDIVTLWGGDPMTSARGSARHEILRPLSVSPLR